MHSHSGISRKWRRFNRKFGKLMFFGFLVLIVMAVVGLLMYLLTRPV